MFLNVRMQLIPAEEKRPRSNKINTNASKIPPYNSLHLSTQCMVYIFSFLAHRSRIISLLEFQQTQAAGYLSSLISSLIPLLSEAQAIQTIPITLL